jgi:hypothetical protein
MWRQFNRLLLFLRELRLGRLEFALGCIKKFKKGCRYCVKDHNIKEESQRDNDNEQRGSVQEEHIGIGWVSRGEIDVVFRPIVGYF